MGLHQLNEMNNIELNKLQSVFRVHTLYHG